MRPAHTATTAAPQTELPDISEKGRGMRGEVISLDRRLFMQMLAFGNCHDAKPVIDSLAASASMTGFAS